MCIFMPMHSQPIPSVTWTDVEELVRRDYSADQVGEVSSILKEYEKDSSDQEPSRVQVAVLKLAHGNVERLRLHIKAATINRRDVVLAAQYPEYLKNGFPVEALPSQRKVQDKLVGSERFAGSNLLAHSFAERITEKPRRRDDHEGL